MNTAVRLRTKGLENIPVSVLFLFLFFLVFMYYIIIIIIICYYLLLSVRVLFWSWALLGVLGFIYHPVIFRGLIVDDVKYVAEWIDS